MDDNNININTGADMWRDNATSYGIMKARIICHSYLAMQERHRHDDPEEMTFCQELREAMTMARNYLHTPVYQHAKETSELNGELDIFSESHYANHSCVINIGEALKGVQFGDGSYDFALAFKALADQHSIERLTVILKNEVMNDVTFNRYPREFYKWAEDVEAINVHDHFTEYDTGFHPNVLQHLIAELRGKDIVLQMDDPHKQLIRECIEGLGEYASISAKENSFSSTAQEVRNLISDLVPYWGLDRDQGAQPLEHFLQEFDNKVEAAIYYDAVPDDSLDVCDSIIRGLHRYGTEMSAAQGSDAMGEILKVSDLMNEVSEKFGYDSALYRDMAGQLVDEVRTILMDYKLPGHAIEGDNVNGYIVKQAVLYDNDVGFAYAHDPDAASPHVSWRMVNDDGKLSYEWGNYYSSEEKAIVNFIERSAAYEYDYKVMEKPLPEPPAPEMPEVKKLIQFIDSDYKELFKIPDGESIRVTYPPDDGREPSERPCKFIDEMHVQIGTATYHICQFAEAMERLGATYEPVNQLQILTLAPYMAGEDKFYKSNREEGNTCVGVVHGSFGSSGEHYHSDWNSQDNGLYTQEVQTELQSVIYALRQDMLKDSGSMAAYCEKHPEARIPEYGDTKVYGFKVETDNRQYFVCCTVEQPNPQFILFAYADKPVQELIQTKEIQQVASSKDKAYTSVLKAIEEGKKAPKPPRKDKANVKRKNKEEEL